MYRWQLLDVKTIIEGYKEHKLIPWKSQKSYYGKAIVIETSKGKFLQSYETIVCGIDNNGQFKRFWNNYSATTAKHIDSFRHENGLSGIGKHEWLALPIENV